VILAVFGALPLMLYGLIAIPFLIGIMTLGGVMSYFTSRPITRRIEALAKQTAALRGGDYAVCGPVDGEDEIAQLQTDFNAMAADLDKTLSALKAERDTVTGLLQTRRELVAGVSHELRTPLAAIRGYLDSALANWQDRPPSTLRHDLNRARSDPSANVDRRPVHAHGPRSDA
jgi:signal transduction histidine kinase